ncbi:MAG: FCD domain-containing protein, partial [Desulfobacterales bacterium]|nr:FCD domain-containing protein [Desulfobacterales bacterium]
VKAFTGKDAEELFTVRSALEELGLRMMFPRLSAKLLREFRGAFERMDAAAAKGDVAASAEADLKFHRMFCLHSGNGRLLTLWDGLVSHVKLFLYMEKSIHRSDTGYVGSHVDLLNAIEERNLGLAEAHLRIHLDSGLRDLLREKFNSPD